MNILGPLVVLQLLLLAGCASHEPVRLPPAGSPFVGPPAAGPADRPANLAAPMQDAVWGEGAGKSYLVPAGDILGFQVLLNVFNREFASGDDYDTDASTVEANLRRGWVIDRDPFAVNQILHPYQGAMYHGFARSAGLNYWESLGYDFVGSAVWEVAGETVPPSTNDQITTTFGGSFLGEALFRMANAVLGSGDGKANGAKAVGATLISPATGFNRGVFGDRFDGLFPGNGAPIFWRAGLGIRHNERATDLGVLKGVQGDELAADFVMDYGLPGKAGYEYERPFDYFHFELTTTSSETSLPENVMVAGLITGERFDTGSLHGVYGLFGTYDYIAPDVFSISSTAVQFGGTGQLKMTGSTTLQGTCLAGVGWAAAGTIADAEVDRSYHYGVCPQGQMGLRLIGGDLAMIDMTGRAYYLDGTGSNDRRGHETILRARLALVVRVYGHHGLAIQYIASSRDARYDDPGLADTNQEVGSVSFLWTWLSDTQFGTVD